MVEVGAYIDGFNLYYGVKSKCGRKHLWLDVQSLVAGLLHPGQVLAHITYFTARFRDDENAVRLQTAYLDALQRHCPLVTIVEGHFQEKLRVCNCCGTGWTDYEEKETDVSIATALIEDAVTDRYDVALLISADSDLCPAVAATRRLRPRKKIVGVFPPGRHSSNLQRMVDGCKTLGLNKVRQAQLPDAIVVDDDVLLCRPREWT